MSQVPNTQPHHFPEAQSSRNAPRRLRLKAAFSLGGQINSRSSGWKLFQVRYCNASLLSSTRIDTHQFQFSAQNALSREAVEEQEDTLEYAGGEFDEDEPVELVKAARDMKRSTVSVRGNRVSVIYLTALSGPLLPN